MTNQRKITNAFILLSSASGPEALHQLSLIIQIFSVLLVFFLIIFTAGWFIRRSAQEKRYRRILMSQRDAVASYNVIKTDVEKGLKSLAEKRFDEASANEIEFLLKHINENLEKMNKYVVSGIKSIGKYDIVENINNKFKLKK